MDFVDVSGCLMFCCFFWGGVTCYFSWTILIGDTSSSNSCVNDNSCPHLHVENSTISRRSSVNQRFIPHGRISADFYHACKIFPASQWWWQSAHSICWMATGSWVFVSSQWFMLLFWSSAAVLHARPGVSARAKQFQASREGCLCKSSDHSLGVIFASQFFLCCF